MKSINRTLKAFLLLSWFSFFLVPNINAIGPAGNQWLELCTLQGVKIVQLSDSDDANTHAKATFQCPSVQFFIGAAYLPYVPVAATKSDISPSPFYPLIQITLYPDAPARAPPSYC